MHTRNALRSVCALFLALVAGGSAPAAEVRINEVMAAPSERRLDWGETGPPKLGSDPLWYAAEFEDGAWRRGAGPLGFGYPDLGTDVGEGMHGLAPSLYVRRAFSASEAEATGGSELRLRITYDDGFVAYLNGTEVARRNLGAAGLFVYADQPAFNLPTHTSEEVISLPAHLLVAGTNVIAIQVHGTWPAYDLIPTPLPFDSNLLVAAGLELGSPATVLVRPTEEWCYFVGHVEPSGGLYDPLLLTQAPADAAFQDWIELHNPGSLPVSLAGWRLTDNAGEPAKWVFPDVTLPEGGYLVVFCSGRDQRDPTAGALHTNFKLDARGEYLGLFDAAGRVASAFAQRYPRIPSSYSWGRDPASDAQVYFRQPTPGRANTGATFAAIVEPPEFSLAPGFYDGPQALTIHCATRHAIVRYTVDGSRPTGATGTEYTGPILLASNVTVRARAFRSGWIPSDAATATYLVDGPGALRTLPALNLAAEPGRTLYSPHGVLTIAGGTYVAGDYWAATGPGDYNMATMYGQAFERPVSVELISPELPGGSAQVDCGLRFAGSRWSRPRMTLTEMESSLWTNSWWNKPSFSLFFRNDYGPETWELPLFAEAPALRFDSLRLRAGKNDWRDPFVRDETVRRLSLAMGHVGSHGLLCNLFVNGEYKGYYNLVERLREPFFQAWHRSTNAWDVLTVDEIADGDAQQWTADMAFVQSQSLSDPANYASMQTRFDLVNLADYLILNIYCATWDWPENNFFVARERRPGAQWRFYVWDAEGTFGLYTSKVWNYNTVAQDLASSRPPYTWPYQVLPHLYRALVQNDEFRVLFADRVQRHLFNGGALTATNVMATFMQLKTELDPTLMHLIHVPVNSVFMTNWVAQRPAVMLQHLREVGLWPETQAPVFNQNGGRIMPGFELTLADPNSGGTAAVYYTLNGADPRGPGGQPAGRFYGGPIPLTASTLVKARILEGATWSALAEAGFDVPLPEALVISEINYEPLEGSALEFVEIHNAGAETVHLAEVGFVEGITFDFPPETTLPAGGYAVLVSDPAAFAARHPGVSVAGVFSGRLDNSGERLTLASRRTNVLFSVRYDNNLPWPVAAAGGGATLVPADSGLEEPDAYRYWRASSVPGGTPGAPDILPPIPPVVINELLPRADAVGAWQIELHNPGPASADISGWYLSDAAATPFKFRLPDATVLAPGEYRVIDHYAMTPVPPANRVALRPEGGELVLFSATTDGLSGYSSAVEYGASSLGMSFGRHTNSQGALHFPPQTLATPEAANAGPAVGPVVFNEIHYHPTTGNAEFVELLNISNNAIPLFDPLRPELTWRINGLDFHFPGSLVLLPGELLLVTGMHPGFVRTKYDVPAGVGILGPWAGALQDNGERLQLQRPESDGAGNVIYVTVDEVRYDDRDPWPTAADGSGASLQRVAAASYGNDPANWAALGLSPGRVNLQSPDVLLIAPAYGAWTTNNGTLQLEAAVDNLAGAISRVEFQVNGATAGQDATAPFAWAWIPTQTGSHTLQAVAVSATGLRFTSAVVRVQVLASTLNHIEPWITRHPAGQVVEAGQDVVLLVESAGSDLNFQWYHAETGLMPAANQSSLLLPMVQSAQAGGYYAVVGNTLGSVTSHVASVTVLLPDLVGAVVINEIMYHPSSEQSAEEFIELLNLHDRPVSLAGWKFDRGVQFDFPPVLIAPDEFLVIAADVPAFRAKYPGVTNVLGGWQGVLRNGGEEIRLQDSLGRTVDRVAYADEGEWAVRKRGPLDLGTRGWEWEATHDGLGRSLELRNPRLAGEHGQNWTSSSTIHGTPGQPNSTATTNLPPLILEVAHAPLVPRSTDAVRITARILDESDAGLAMTLFYRDHSTTSPPPFLQIAMADDGQQGDGAAGDRVYGALIAPQTNGTVMEFYVAARDASGAVRTWPAPARTETGLLVQAVNAQYQVDDEIYTGGQPLLRLVLTETERHTHETINRYSNAEMNATLISSDGVEQSVRYNAGFRLRGASTRGQPVPNRRLNIPSDRRWKGVTAINLNTYFAHAPVIGSMVSFKAGLTVADARAVQLRLNGVNPAQAGPPNFTDGSGFGTFVLVEVVNADWSEHHFPNDPNGNIYLARRPNTDLAYLGTNWLTYLGYGYAKGSNQSENDWSDLIRLTDVLNNTPDATYAQTVREVLDPQEWVRYFALNSVLGNNESSLAVGVGDDYNMYRGVQDPRFLLIPHDWDTILGQAGALPPDTDIFLAAALPAVSRFLKHPEFVPLYYGELKRLIDTVCSPAQLHPLLDQFLGGYVDPATLAGMKQYVTARANYLQARIPQALTLSNALPVVGGFPRSTTPTVTLWGQANAINTRSVFVNGEPSQWSAWEARWTNQTLVLSPGVNRVRVQAFDQHGAELDHLAADIWYDDGTETVVPGGTLPGDTTWTAANGPYALNGHLTIPAGATLHIEPGTTIFAAPTVILTVHGRLLAQGTPDRYIRFTRRPGVAGLWNGFDVYNSTADNRLSYAVIDQCGWYPIDVRNSKLHLDHVIFRGLYGSIYTTNSTLQIRNCVFPNMLGAETIIGYGVPTNGYVILDGNTFGGTMGYADIIDFTGGRRPDPIFQAYNNVFLSGSDDGLDLDDTDAHIEGNTFMNFHRDGPRESISCGIGTDAGSHIVAVRNIFFSCDNAVLLKRKARLTAQNNTFVGLVETAIDFGSTNRAVSPGAGALFEGNISWNNTSTFERFYEPGYSEVDLTVSHSIIPGTNWPGTGNLNLDPRFVNPSNDFRLRPGSPALRTGPNGLDIGAHVPAGASVSGEPPPLTAQDGAVLTVAGPGITHYRYQLNHGPFSEAEFAVTNPLTLANLPDGTYQVSLIGKNSAGAWQSPDAPTRSRAWTVQRGLQRLWLNELLARNDSAYNHYGTFPDLVELYNAGGGVYDLSGLQLTDDPAVPGKFVFPAGLSLEPGEHLVLFADDPNGTPGWHLGFSLRREGEALYLFAPASQGGALLDSVSFGLQLPDFSIGRLPDGTWTLMRPTFGAANEPAWLGDPATLRITEWLARGPGDDFIELYNSEAAPVPLGGLFLTDHARGWPDRHRIADLSFAPANGYVLFRADGNVDAGADHVNFGLAYEQGMIGLLSPDRELIDLVMYGPQRFNISSGRIAPGSEAIVEFSNPSPGATNLFNVPPTVAFVRPAPGEIVPVPQDVLLSVVAADLDGEVLSVGFYEGNHLLGVAEARPFTIVWSNVPAGTHTVVARAVDNGGAVTLSEPLTFHVGVTTVVLTSPVDGMFVPIGITIPLSATVLSVTDSIARVEFYAGASKLGEVTHPPYELPWTGTNPGPVLVRAVAKTPADNAFASAPASVRWLNAEVADEAILVNSNVVWKYWDQALAPAGDWTASGFDDAAWPSGPAELGYGEAAQGRPEATVIGFGPNPNNVYPTAYFRHQFMLNDARAWRSLNAALLVDDGALVYLNGREVIRQNMPSGTITHTSYALGGAPEDIYLPFQLSPDLLINGTNQLAVEVHQVQPASSDLSFALALTGAGQIVEPWIISPPADAAVEAGYDTSLWVEAFGMPLAYQWFRADGTAVSGGNGPVLYLRNAQPAQAGGYTVRITNSLGAVTSPQAILHVDIPDRDEDGIPDYWERQTGMNPADPTDADADWDGDLAINRREYHLQTSPWIPNLFLRADPAAETGAIQLAFRAEAGTRYLVEFASTPTAQTWHTLTNLPTFSVTTIVEFPTPATDSRFYRARVVP